MTTSERFVMLEAPEGPFYVDLDAIDCIGPSMSDSIGGRTLSMRLLYLRGGQGVAILDTADNMGTVFATKGMLHA